MTSVSVIDDVTPLPVSGVIPDTLARVHTYVAAGLVLLLVAVYVVCVLLHRWGAVELLVMTAVGLTLAVMFDCVPAHPSTEAVTA